MTRTRTAGVKFAFLIALLVGAWLLLQALGVDVADLSPERIRQFVLSFGVWAPAVYLAGYGQPIVPLPASVMLVAAGLAFGTGWGMAAALAGSMIRACGAFLLARRLGREAIARLLHGHIARLDESISRNGLVAVLLIRLVSGLPYDVQNYSLGFTKVAFGPYVLGTLLGISPLCFAFVFFGHALTDPRHLWVVVLAIVLVAGLAAAVSRART